MSHATPSLTIATPLTLPSGLVLPNRIMKSALSEGLADSTGTPGQALERLYTRWSGGGYGLLVTGNVMVDRRYLGEPGNAILDADADLESFRRWAKGTQDGGSPIWMQINHPGRQANPLTTDGPTVAPSAVGLSIPGVPAPRELSATEIEDTINRFAETARLADAAGFDGVQVHAAHGYLISQFLSPLVNHRADQWGGSVDNRARLLLDIIGAIRAAVRPGFAVGVKINSADFQRGGFTEDESRVVIGLLAETALDLIEISGGSYESPAMMGFPVASERTRAREAYFLEYTATVRELTTIPLAVTGGFRTRRGMEEALQSGACDVVGLGRPAATTPAIAARLISGVSTEVPRHSPHLALPPVVARSALGKSLSGVIDLQWHTDQLHTLGAGADPDVERSPWRTLVSAVRRNGIGPLRSSLSGGGRGIEQARPAGLRKFRFERQLGRHLLNPTVAALGRVGITTTMAAALETTGRKSGQLRSVPVAAAFDATGAWVISQHGRRSGWAHNISADPRVRIQHGSRWRSGTAEFVPDDDVIARSRAFAPHPLVAPLTAATFRALQSTPMSVRITFTDTESAAPEA